MVRVSVCACELSDIMYTVWMVLRYGQREEMKRIQMIERRRRRRREKKKLTKSV